MTTPSQVGNDAHVFIAGGSNSPTARHPATPISAPLSAPNLPPANFNSSPSDCTPGEPDHTSSQSACGAQLTAAAGANFPDSHPWTGAQPPGAVGDQATRNGHFKSDAQVRGAVSGPNSPTSHTGCVTQRAIAAWGSHLGETK